jgi:hypothetical protein
MMDRTSREVNVKSDCESTGDSRRAATSTRAFGVEVSTLTCLRAASGPCTKTSATVTR